MIENLAERLGAASTWVLAVALVAIGAFAYTYVLSSGLFVFTEARDMILLPNWPGDLPQWLLFPEPHWGPSRLTGMATFQITGRVCGTDVACVSGVGALLTGLAVVLLMVHTRQVTRSAWIAVVVSVLWLISPSLLGISFWQAARFDLLAFIGVMAAGILWWWAFGRPRLPPAAMLGVALLSIPLMAFAFGSKEVTYYLVGLIVAMAIGRGIGRSGWVWRNLLVAALPLAYGTFYVWHAITHISDAYASHGSSADLITKGSTLLRQTFGIDDHFMFLQQLGPRFEALVTVAKIGFVVFLVLVVATFILACWKGLLERPTARLRTREWALLTRRVVPWAYLAGTFALVLAISARSNGAASFYMPIAYWAILALGATALVWMTRRFAAQRLILGAFLVLYTIPAFSAYAALLTEESTYGQLESASKRMADAGAVLRGALRERDVERVDWRIDDVRPNAFYVTRGDTATNLPSNDIWAWLMHDRSARPEVEAIAEGSLDELRSDLQSFAGDGQVLIVMDRMYDLQFVAYEGEILWDPSAGR